MAEQPNTQAPMMTRRSVVRGATVGGVALPVLAACGSDEEPSGGSEPTDPADASTPPETGGALVAAADVPVGGGVVVEGEDVVVTQPADGELKAFTAVCTHQGCIVNKIEDDVISCPCHGSTYSALDGSNLAGPATEPLAEVAIEVADGQVVRS